MEKLIETLQKLKVIEPEKEYTLRSRGLIVGTGFERRPRTTWEVFSQTLQFGASLALTGLLIFLILGGFSSWGVFSPLRLSSLDPSSLRVEAQAIDIQIQLTNLNYAEPAIKTSESTQSAQRIAPQKGKPNEKEQSSEKVSSSSPSEPISIDDALLKLSE